MLAKIAKLQAQLGPNAKRRVRAGDVIARESQVLGMQAAERLDTFVNGMLGDDSDEGMGHTMPILRPNVRSPVMRPCVNKPQRLLWCWLAGTCRHCRTQKNTVCPNASMVGDACFRFAHTKASA